MVERLPAEALDAFVQSAGGIVPTPNLQGPVRPHVQAVKQTPAPWAARHMYLNFSQAQLEAARFWTEEVYHRLRRINDVVDPRQRHPLKPPCPARQTVNTYRCGLRIA